jgi:hypothetical protein
MPRRKGGRVSATFLGGFKKSSTKKKRDSVTTEEISDDKFGELPDKDIGVDEEETRISKLEDSKRQEALSSLLTGTSVRRLTQVSSTSTRDKPQKSILKATSSISADSGHQNQFFTAPSGPKDTKISFNHISVRSYPVLIGDNPSVTQGVPLTIGWEHDQEESYNVDVYESDHKSEPVASLAEMKFSEEERAAIAKNLGYSDNKIHKIAHQVKFSTLTTKKKIIRTLKLDKMKKSVKRGMGKVSESSRKLLGGSTSSLDSEEEEESDDGRDMAF